MNENEPYQTVKQSLSRVSRVPAGASRVDGSSFPFSLAQRSVERVRSQRMWNTLWVELREVIWLASVVGGLTLVAAGVVVALAVA